MKKPDKYSCPNKAKHVSAFPAFDRVECPYCENDAPVYIKKEA